MKNKIIFILLKILFYLGWKPEEHKIEVMPEQYIAQYAMRLDADGLTQEEYHLLKERVNRITEVTQVLWFYIQYRNHNEYTDNVRRETLKAWAEGKPTPETYKGLFRRK